MTAHGLSRCPRCDNELIGEEKFCPNCRHVLAAAATPVGIGAKLTNCPICKLSIYPAKMGKYEILHCAECEGTAYKKEVLMKMQAMDPKKIETGELESSHVTPPYFEKREKPPFLICPFCGKKMPSKKIGQMQVDICDECGAVFLDSGKEKHINDLLGPYKRYMMNSGDSGPSRRQRR